MDFWHKIGSIFTQPETFFRAVKGDTGFLDAWKFYAYASAISVGLSILLVIPLMYLSVMQDPEGTLAVYALALFIGVFGLLFGYFAGLGLIFVSAGISHLFLLLVGAKGGFYQTFKIVSYAYIIGIVTVPFAYAVSFLPSLAGELVYYGIEFLVFIFIIYVQVTGARVLHDLSVVRALLGVLVLPIAVIGAIIFMLLMLVLLLFGVTLLSLGAA